MAFIGMGLGAAASTPKLFAATAYNGTGSAQDIITGQNTAAGALAWLKRTSTIEDHYVFDTERGAHANLSTNTTSVEDVDLSSLTSFNSNGFSLGSFGQINGSGTANVAFTWLKQAGYLDIIARTGTGSGATTAAHDNGSAPGMVFVKSRSAASGWQVWHKSFNAGDYLRLDQNAAKVTGNPAIFNLAPSASVINLGTNLNNSGETYIIYSFAEKAGFSKAGTYSGTGAIGNSITGLGFTPSIVLAKRIGGTENWALLYGNNGSNMKFLEPNTNAVTQFIPGSLDDNGFTLNSGSTYNISGGSYIYMAWA